MEPQDGPERPSYPPAVPTPYRPVPQQPPQPPPADPDPWATGRRAAGATSSVPPWVRRFRPRSLRGAVGLGLLGAALLLLPFLDDPDRWWIPVGLGFGTLVLLYLLRLDKVLFGWAPHVAGAVLVGALVWATSANPFAWGLAVGVGVVVAGLLLLPRWHVLAAGAVLLVLAGIGYQFRSAELADQQARIDAQAGEQMRTVLGVTRPQLAVVGLDNGVGENDPDRICRILQDPAMNQVRAATGATDCAGAVQMLHQRAAGVTIEPSRPNRDADPVVAPGQTTTVDACSTLWAATAGTGLGRIQLVRTDAPQQRFQVTGFQPC